VADQRREHIAIETAQAGALLGEARALFLEYARSLDFSLCFQGFDSELQNLPGDYAPPGGTLMVAVVDGAAAGCVALRPESGDAAEMKRLYVRPAYRGLGLGRALAEAAMSAARKLGYSRIRLDTVALSMRFAVKLYQAMGFQEIAPYTANPVDGARFFEMHL
jgi:putative acetyltransferase